MYLNGNEWAKHQATQKGIGFKALDNGFAACEDPSELAEICQACRPRTCGCSSIVGKLRCPRR